MGLPYYPRAYLFSRHSLWPTQSAITAIHVSHLDHTRVWVGDSLGSTHTLVAKQAQEHWVKDEEVSHCSSAECRVRFGLLERRHHCRRCGLIFCSRHSNRTAAVPLAGYYKKVRVCEGCFVNLCLGDMENERRRAARLQEGQSKPAAETSVAESSTSVADLCVGDLTAADLSVTPSEPPEGEAPDDDLEEGEYEEKRREEIDEEPLARGQDVD